MTVRPFRSRRRAPGPAAATTAPSPTAAIRPSRTTTLVARGRDPMSLLNLLPGAVPNFGSTILGGTVGTAAPTVQGQPAGSFQMSVNGMPSNDGDLTGKNATFATPAIFVGLVQWADRIITE